MELSLDTPEAITTQAPILSNLLLAYGTRIGHNIERVHLSGGRTMSNDNESAINLEDAYALKTPQDNRALYRNWASTYDADFAQRNKYVYPKGIATICAGLVEASSSLTILDIGCGTGIVGTCLSELISASIIDGVDISLEMLHVASTKLRVDTKPVYGQLFEADLTEPILFAKAKYDVAISAGTFTHGHLGPDALINVLGVLRPGGRMVVGINKEHFGANGFEAALQQATDSQLISAPSFTEVQIYDQGSPHYGDLALVTTFLVRSPA
ncbi:MAG: class I SAM-dependent methyltransferase [Actinobacteria bacterium]|nr:MAG: class I SAM-dependent methyltransferase [Actinomycetota bacterium]